MTEHESFSTDLMNRTYLEVPKTYRLSDHYVRDPSPVLAHSGSLSFQFQTISLFSFRLFRLGGVASRPRWSLKLVGSKVLFLSRRDLEAHAG